MIPDSMTHEIIGLAYKVHNTLGSGFLEKVYENALIVELHNSGYEAKKQQPITVYYEGNIVGEYFADIIVDDELIIELKAVQRIAKIHEVQLVNYLQATKTDIGLLINFGEKVEVRRKYRIYKQLNDNT
ncbi:GxxExxY protein [Bacteroidales bacterium]|nr:GxxExxY protein [Bacteroidales bacterium]